MDTPPSGVMYKLRVIWNRWFTNGSPVVDRSSIVLCNFELPHEGIDSFKIMNYISAEGGVVSSEIIANCSLVAKDKDNTTRESLFPCILRKELNEVRRCCSREDVNLRGLDRYSDFIPSAVLTVDIVIVK